MIKLICLIVLSGSFVLIGKGVKEYYAKRKKLYENTLKLIETLTSEITFLKTDISSICRSHSYGVHLDKLIKQYYDAKQVSADYLSDSENKLYNEFFASLGNKDVAGELNNLQYYKTKFSAMYDNATMECSSKGNLSFKLISLAGVVLSILFI